MASLPLQTGNSDSACPLSGLEFISHTRHIRKLSIERLPVPQTTSQELRPFRHGQIRIDLLRKKFPEFGMVPTQLMSSTVALPANPQAQFLHFREQLVSRKLFQVFVHSFPPPCPGRAGLNLSRAAVDVELNAGDVRSLRTRKEHHGVGDVFALSKPLHGRASQDCSRQLAHGFFGHAELPENWAAIGPGLTAFPRIPRPTSSVAATRTRERSAALLAGYTLGPGRPTRYLFSFLG